MKTEIVQSLTATFEVHAQQTEGGVEYWLARDLQFLLGYSKWDNFLNVVTKAKNACEVSGHAVADHFADVGEMVDLGSGSQRDMRSETVISQELITNNKAVRDTLLERGIRPESVAPVEDVKKLERRLASEEKKSLKDPDGLSGVEME